MEVEIKISINLPYFDGAIEKLPGVLRSRKFKSTFYNERTLYKLLKLLANRKVKVAREDKDNIVQEIINCSNGKAFHFGESKQSLKWRSDKHKRSLRNCDCETNETAKDC